MNKIAKLLSLFALLLTGTALMSQAEPKAAEAVSATRLYIVLTDDIKNAAPTRFEFWTGTGGANIVPTKLSDSDPYTYYYDGTVNTNMAFKGWNGTTRTVNLYNISNSGRGTIWDTIVFNASIIGLDGSAAGKYTTAVYTPPVVGEEYTVTLYNGDEILGTNKAYENVTYTPSDFSVSGHTFKGWYLDYIF